MNNKLNMELLNLLPNEILVLIWSYVDIKQKIWVTKSYYEKYHKLILPDIPRFNSYMHFIIRNKYDYLFNIMLKDNYTLWINKKKWPYKEIIFNNYLDYLLYLCNKSNASKLKEILANYKKSNINVNKYKIKRTNYNRWTN